MVKVHVAGWQRGTHLNRAPRVIQFTLSGTLGHFDDHEAVECYTDSQSMKRLHTGKRDRKNSRAIDGTDRSAERDGISLERLRRRRGILPASPAIDSYILMEPDLVD